MGSYKSVYVHEAFGRSIFSYAINLMDSVMKQAVRKLTVIHDGIPGCL